MDELVAEIGLENVMETILVDHNILDQTQSDLAESVVGIVDHHEDRKAYDDQIAEKVCRFIGSCSSLITFKFIADIANFNVSKENPP